MNEELYKLLGINPESAREKAFTQGLLGSIFQAAALSGPQTRPISTAQALGQVGLAGMGAYESSFDKTLKEAITGLQVKDLVTKQAEAERIRKAGEQFRSRISGATRTLPTAQSFAAQQTNISPEMLEGMSVQDVAQQAVSAGLPTQEYVDQGIADRAVMDYLRVASPVEYAKIVAKEPKAAPADIQGYQLAVQQGYTGSFLDYKKALGESGAQKIELKMGGGIASQIGPILRENQVAATGAALQIDAADRIISAVDTGKVISGPGTTPVLRAAQIGRILGVTGKDTNEIIANTRMAVRGLAEMTLQGRKSMRGEGQITESEGKLAERAFSGDIADLTNDEIKILANASKRAAQFTLSEYNKKLDTLEQNPETAPLIPFFRVNVMPSMSGQPGQPGLPSGVSVRKK